MPVAILPDISEQHCIGCALCVEICTALGPDVLRVKPVAGWQRGKAFVFYPERCISDGACIGVCPTKAIFWMRPMEYTAGQPAPLKRARLFHNSWEELVTIIKEERPVMVRGDKPLSLQKATKQVKQYLTYYMTENSADYFMSSLDKLFDKINTTARKLAAKEGISYEEALHEINEEMKKNE